MRTFSNHTRRVSRLLGLVMLLVYGSLQAQIRDTRIPRGPEALKPEADQHAACGFNIPYLDKVNAAAHAAAAQQRPLSGQNPGIMPFPAGAWFTCGMFNVYYDDIAFGTGEGFDSPGFGADRRNTLCAVLSYVESVWDITDTIDLHILTSWHPSNLPPPSLTTALAIGGPYLPPAWNTTPGVYNGYLYDHIVNGVDPDPAMYDHFIQVNFNYQYYSNHTVFPGNCWYDLYSVLLHEVTHGMGWFSNITEDTGSPSGDAICQGVTDRFTLYDNLFLFNGDVTTGSFTKFVIPSGSGPTLNPALPSFPVTSADVWLHNSMRPNNHPVFSGPNVSWDDTLRMSLLSHLDDRLYTWSFRTSYSPGLQVPYVMSPVSQQGGVKREWSLAEQRAMITMGYPLNPAYAAATGLSSGAVTNAFLLNNNVPPSGSEHSTAFTHTWTYPDSVPIAHYTITNPGPPLVIDLSLNPDLTDGDGDPITVFPGSLFNIRGCGNGGNNTSQLTVSGGGSIITYTPRPDFIGRAQFGFNLYDGKEKGAFMLYTIDVNPAAGYSTGIPGEMVLNGGWEEGTEVRIVNTAENLPNTPIDYAEFEGQFYCGTILSDARPFSFASNWWTAGGGEVVAGSFNFCVGTTHHGMFGHPFTGVPSSFAVVTPATGDRMHRLRGGGNYSRIYPAAKTCHRYIIEGDINFVNSGLTVGSLYNLTAEFHDYPTTPWTNTPEYAQAIDFTVNTVTGWQHFVDTLYYCGGDSAEYLNLRDNIWSWGVLLDNLSLREDTSPWPLLATATASPGSVCPGSPSQLGVTVQNTYCAPTFSWTPAATLNSSTIQNPIATPTAATTYTVTVNDGCRTTTSSVSVTLTGNTVSAGPDLTICAGGTAALNATTSQPATFTWTGCNLSSTSVQNPTATPTSTCTYIVTADFGGGCTATDTVVVNVVPGAFADAGPDQTLCAGGSTVIGTAGTGACVWTPAAGLSNPNDCQPMASPSVTTTYVVTTTSPGGCTDTDTVTVFVVPAPVANAGPDVTICGSGSAILNGSGGGSYFWTPPAGLSCTTCPNPTVTASVSTSYVLTVSDSNGCKDTDTVQVIIVDTPTVTTSGDTKICAGDSVLIQAFGTGVSCLWSPAAGLADPTDCATMASPATTTLYTVTVTDANGCTAQASLTVYVLTPAVANAGPDQTICAGGSTVIGTASSFSCFWTPATGLSNPADCQPTASPSVTTTYILTSTSSDGCTDADTVTVFVNPGPTANAGPDLTICGGGSGTLSGSGGGSYFWSPASGLSCTTCPSPTVTISGSATYVLTVTDANGCTDTDTVNVNSYPAAIVTSTGNTKVCKGDSIPLFANLSTGSVSCVWSPATGLSDPFDCTPMASPSVATLYTVTLTDIYGCTYTANVFVSVLTPAVALAGPDISLCGPGSFILNGSGIGTPLWTPSIGLTNPTSYVTTGSTSTTMTYVLTTIHPNTGCRDRDTVVVTVDSMPHISLSSPGTFCEWDNSGYVLFGSPGGGTWSGPGVTAPDIFTPSLAGAGTHTLTYTVVNGACTATATTTVTVLPGLGSPYWPKFATNLHKSQGMGVVTDGAGSTYAIGWFSGTMYLPGFGPLVSNQTDIWVAKFTDDCGTAWVRTFGGSDNDGGNDIDLDGNGRVWITGYFEGPTTFDSYTLNPGLGGSEAFVAQLDPSTGNTILARQSTSITAPSNARGVSIKVNDVNNTVHVLGEFEGRVRWGSNPTLNTTGGGDVFVVKFNAGGIPLWSRRTGSASANNPEYAGGIGVDGAGNVYIGISAADDITFASTTYPNAGFSITYDLFMAKYNGLGTELTARMVGTISRNQFLRDLATDAAGNCYITGQYQGAIGLGGVPALPTSSSRNIFMAKVGPTFTTAWGYGAGNSGSPNDEGRTVTVAPSGDPYFAGYFSTTGQFPGFSPSTITTAGSREVFVASISAAGTPGYVMYTQGSGAAGTHYANGISVAPSTLVYTTGQVGGNTPVNFSLTSHTPMGPSNAFVARNNMANFFRLDQTVTDEEQPETDALQQAKLFPNPTQGRAELRFREPLSETARIRVTDLLGRTVEAAVINRSAPDAWTLNLENLPDGVYLVHAEDGDQSFTLRLAVQK